MDQLRDINSKHVIVIVTFLVTTAGLVAFGKDIAAFVVVGLAVLGGIGVIVSKQAETKQETQVIREQTNGTQTRMVEMMADQARQAQATNERLVNIIERQGALLASMVRPDELPAIAGVVAPLVPSPDPAAPDIPTVYGRNPVDEQYRAA